MGFSFHLTVTAVKELRKKKKVRSKADEFEGARRRRRAMVKRLKPVSRSSGFDKIPEELLMKILSKLPAKHVTRLMCVSQLWYSLIASSYFTRLFLESPSSAKRLRLLVYFVDKAEPWKYKFLTSSLTHDDRSDTSVSVIDKVVDIPGLEGHFVTFVHGLLCVRRRRSVRICNLTTKQLVELPIIRSRIVTESTDNIYTYFAHDPVHNEYKVLITVSEVSKEEDKVVSSEHQVLVLGPGASWRNTKSRSHIYPHRPYSQGININGVWYSGSWIDKKRCVVMSFNFASEDFKLIELPVEAGILWHLYHANVMNYKGKLAVFEYSRLASNGSANLWVMEGNSKWSNKTLVLPISHMNFVNGNGLTMVSMVRPNEVRLSLYQNVDPGEPKSYVIYDLEKNKIRRRLHITPLPGLWLYRLKDGLQTTVLEDDTENIMYLET